MPELFSPLTIRSLTLRNRVVVSPMCQYSSEDGFANDWHLVHLGSFARAGAALVFTEATAVSPEGRISPQDLGLWKDAHGEMLARIVRFVKSQGAAAGIQLAHAGRKASTLRPWDGNGPVTAADGGWQPVAPSAIPFADGGWVPKAADARDLEKIVADFRAGARRARELGFDVIELHAAHGYLLHEFLSPLSNHRSDGYGGAFDNRIRLVREVVAAIRQEWTGVLFVRISATDWVDGGWDVDQSVALARVLKQDGVDLMDCSSGALVPHAKIPVGPGFQVPFAARIRAEAGIATGAVGMIVEPAQADEIIRSGQADVVLLARQLLRDPHFALHAGEALGQEVVWPKQYERARR